MCLERGTPGPLLRLDLFTTGSVVSGVSRAQEFLDEVLPPTPLGEGPLAQTSTHDLEVLKDRIAVDNVSGLHDASPLRSASPCVQGQSRRLARTSRSAAIPHSLPRCHRAECPPSPSPWRRSCCPHRSALSAPGPRC